MVIIIDFDGVLFNDRRFKEDFRRIFGRLGITPERDRCLYEEAKKRNGGIYHLRHHLTVLKKVYPRMNTAASEKKIGRLLKRSVKYVYKDSISFLEFLKRRKINAFLLSTGSPAFQGEKIKHSGLAGYFKKVIVVTSCSKSGAFAGIMRRYSAKDMIFIDDKKEVVEEVKKKLPKVFVVQMRRGLSQEKSYKTDAVIKNFVQLKRLIKIK